MNHTFYHNIINQIMYCIFHDVLFLRNLCVRRGPYKGKTLSPNPNVKQCNIIMFICSIRYLLFQNRIDISSVIAYLLYQLHEYTSHFELPVLPY